MINFKRNVQSGKATIWTSSLAAAFVFMCGCKVIPFDGTDLPVQVFEQGSAQERHSMPPPQLQQNLQQHAPPKVYSLGDSPADLGPNAARIANNWQDSRPRQATMVSVDKTPKSRMDSFLDKLRPGTFLNRERGPVSDTNEPGNAEFHRARKLENAGQLAQAIDIYESLVESGDQSVELSHRLAVAYDKDGRSDLSLPFFKRALAIQPRNVELLCDYGYRWHLVDNTREAEYFYSLALEILPSHVRTQNNLAMLLAQTNRIDQALQHFRFAGLNNEQAHHNVSVALQAISTNPPENQSAR